MGLRDFVEKLTEPLEALELKKIRAVCSRVPGVTPIAEVVPRERFKIAGAVQNMRIVPRPTGAILEVTLNDATGLAVARWLGRARIQGVDVGRYLAIEGTATPTPEGGIAFVNPYYELLYVD